MMKSNEVNPYVVSVDRKCACDADTKTGLNPFKILHEVFLPFNALKSRYYELARMMPKQLMTSKTEIQNFMNSRGNRFHETSKTLHGIQFDAVRNNAMKKKYIELEGHAPNSDRIGVERIYKEWWNEIFSKFTMTGPQQYHTQQAQNLKNVLDKYNQNLGRENKATWWFAAACPFPRAKLTDI